MEEREKMEIEIQILTDICNCFKFDPFNFQEKLDKEKLQQIKNKYVDLLGEEKEWN